METNTDDPKNTPSVSNPRSKNKWINTLIALIVIAIIGIAGYFVNNKYFVNTPKFEIIYSNINELNNIEIAVYLAEKEVNLNGIESITKNILNNQAKNNNNILITFYNNKDAGLWYVAHPAPVIGNQSEIDQWKSNEQYIVCNVLRANRVWEYSFSGDKYKSLNNQQFIIN